jgi:hypothetical protein
MGGDARPHFLVQRRTRRHKQPRAGQRLSAPAGVFALSASAPSDYQGNPRQKFTSLRGRGMPRPYRIAPFAAWRLGARETFIPSFSSNPKSLLSKIFRKWTRKMPDFAGLSYFFENEVSSSTISPTEKKLFKQEPTEITEEKMMTPFPPSLPIQNPKSKIQNF